MVEAQAFGGSADDEAGFVVIDNRTDEQRQSGADSGEVEFVITDETNSRRRAQESASVGVDQPLPRARKCSVCGETGHTSRTCPNVGSTERVTRAPRASGSALTPAVPMLIGMCNMAVVTTFGENCGISDKETQFMVPSMQRMAERMPPAAAKAVSIWIDPCVIISCFIYWGARIRAIKREEARIAYQVTPFENARANGYTGSSYSVPPNQETNAPQSGVPIDSQQVEPTSNGVPQSIRDAFNDHI